MKNILRQPEKFWPSVIIIVSIALFMTAGCGVGQKIESYVGEQAPEAKPKDYGQASDYYENFYNELSRRGRVKGGTSQIRALDALPKDASGKVDWTAAVVKGIINPRASLDPDYVEEPPLNLNIFIEAKVPLMANVLFPHSIHTYWLNCSTCHPKIFLPEAGANPISMDEIFQGKWCGRCHGKVAFTFWPRSNCTRCHTILKGQSLEQERWR